MYKDKVICFKTLAFKASLKMRPFVRFLKENRALVAYNRNHIDIINELQKGAHDGINFTTNWNQYQLGEIVSIAFIWAYTSEGREFWNDLHDKWKKIVMSMTEKQKKELNNIVLKLRNEKYKDIPFEIF